MKVFLITVLISLSFLIPSSVFATTDYFLELMGSRDDTIELSLYAYDMDQGATLEIFYSEGMEFVELDTSSVSFKPTVNIEDERTIRIEYVGNGNSNIKPEVNLGVLKFNRISESVQNIEVSDISDPNVAITRYYEISSIEGIADNEVLWGIDLSSFLVWAAIVIGCTVSILVYFLYTTYKEERSSQQYILIGIGGIIGITLLNMLLAMTNYRGVQGTEVMGIQMIRMERQEDTTQVKGVEKMVAVCDLNWYASFLSEYLSSERGAEPIEMSYDLSDNGIIDNVDLDYFTKCLKNGE